MLYRVENKISGDVFYVKCSRFGLGSEDLSYCETDCLSFTKLDEYKWPYNEVKPDYDLIANQECFMDFVKTMFPS